METDTRTYTEAHITRCRARIGCTTNAHAHNRRSIGRLIVDKSQNRFSSNRKVHTEIVNSVMKYSKVEVDTPLPSSAHIR